MWIAGPTFSFLPPGNHKKAPPGFRRGHTQAFTA